jgi:hypothetical protein
MAWNQTKSIFQGVSLKRPAGRGAIWEVVAWVPVVQIQTFWCYWTFFLIVCVVSDTEKPLLPDGIWTDSKGWSTKMWHQSCQDVLVFFFRSYGKKCIWILVPTCDSYQVTLARQTGLPFVRAFLLNLHLCSSSFWQDYFKSQNLLSHGFNLVNPTINGDGSKPCPPGEHQNRW